MLKRMHMYAAYVAPFIEDAIHMAYMLTEAMSMMPLST